MTSLSYTKPARLSLKDHPEFTERWLQERITDDPVLRGLGDLVLKDKGGFPQGLDDLKRLTVHPARQRNEQKPDGETAGSAPRSNHPTVLGGWATATRRRRFKP